MERNVFITSINSPRLEHQYRQVQSLVVQLFVSSNAFRPLTAFEQVLLSLDKKKVLSRIYNILLEAGAVIDRVKLRREKDLGVMFSEDRWKQITLFNHMLSNSVSV